MQPTLFSPYQINRQDYVRKRINVEQVVDGFTPCWVWTKHLVDGYGHGMWNGETLAHRVGWMAFVGEIPQGLHIDHLCRNRACCNPEHLEPVTPLVNARRGNAPSARAVRTNRCQRGHEFTSENTYTSPSGVRGCQTCIDVRNAAMVQKRAAARAIVRADKIARGLPIRTPRAA